jgi:hypothetical protein
MPESVIKPNYSGFPEETFMRQLRNALIELKKAVQSSQNIEELNMLMEQFLNANRRVVWSHQTSAVFRKDEAEKAVAKVTTEYQRYVKDLRHHQSKKSYQDLMDALSMVESMLDRAKEGR